MHSRLAAVTAAHAAARTMCIAVKTNMADFSSLDQEVKVKKGIVEEFVQLMGALIIKIEIKSFPIVDFQQIKKSISVGL